MLTVLDVIALTSTFS